eukprot:Nitzschia sp. Nitz4//scaffold6_size259037//121416//122409//NITZ4_001073-RA/size259037-augustus-gene-0.321-mRNA-1//-1//CDS//3329556890//7688//frame0
MRNLFTLLFSTLGSLCFWGLGIPVAQAYPMIIEVSEASERCIRFTVPEDDDANVVFLVLPSMAGEDVEENSNWEAEQSQMEEYFMLQMSLMQKFRVRSSLPKTFPDKPDDNVSRLMSKFIDQMDGEEKSGCKVVLKNPSSGITRSMDASWFDPIVMNHLRKVLRSSGQEDKVPLEGYEFCFENTSPDFPLQMAIETILTSETLAFQDDDRSQPAFESSNLTPLAEQLALGIESAQTVLNEMRYMEGRERRMRQTADSINSRVRYFSYISVTVLIVVTYVQVTYLKQYFHKKKLL